MNFIDSLSIKTKKFYLLALGFFLFIFCDVCVGINNLRYNEYSAILMWSFYLPSQVLLFLTSCMEDKNK